MFVKKNFKQFFKLKDNPIKFNILEYFKQLFWPFTNDNKEVNKLRSQLTHYEKKNSQFLNV